MSMNTPTRKQISAAVASVLASSLGAQVANAQLEEVIVTATKRAKSMQEVPVAVSALKENSLDELRIGNFDDYVMFLPNVISQGTGPGQNEIFIRAGNALRRFLSGRHRPPDHQQAGLLRREGRLQDQLLLYRGWRRQQFRRGLHQPADH